MNPDQKTLMFPDQPNSGPLWIKMVIDEEVREIWNLSNEERGLLFTLRLYSLSSPKGIPENLDELWKDLRNSGGISRYKLRKLWPRIEPFLSKNFSTILGFLRVDRDEEKVSDSRRRIAKAQKAGQLSAMARWGADSPQAQNAGNSAGNKTVTTSPNNPEPEPEPRSGSSFGSSVDYLRGATAPTNAREPGGGGGPTPKGKTSKPKITLTSAEHGVFAARCAELNLAVPSKALCQYLRDLWPELSVPELVSRLVLWPGQDSPGLWRHRGRVEFEAESMRQGISGASNKRPDIREERISAAVEGARKILKDRGRL